MASATSDVPPQPENITALWPVNTYTAWRRKQVCVNNLPLVVTWKWNSWKWSNMWPLSHESNALTITPPSDATKNTRRHPECALTMTMRHTSAAMQTVSETAITRVLPASWAAAADSCGRAATLVLVITSTGGCVTGIQSAHEHIYIHTGTIDTFHVKLDRCSLVTKLAWLVQIFSVAGSPSQNQPWKDWTSSFLALLLLTAKEGMSACPDPSMQICIKKWNLWLRCNSTLH